MKKLIKWALVLFLLDCILRGGIAFGGGALAVVTASLFYLLEKKSIKKDHQSNW